VNALNQNAVPSLFSTVPTTFRIFFKFASLSLNAEPPGAPPQTDEKEALMASHPHRARNERAKSGIGDEKIATAQVFSHATIRATAPSAA